MNSLRNLGKRANLQPDKKVEVMNCQMTNQEGIKRKKKERAAQKREVKEEMKRRMTDQT